MSRQPFLNLTPDQELRPQVSGLHYRMLGLFKNYHKTAKNNPLFSLRATLYVFAKFVQNDPWLSTVVKDELRMLSKNNIDNPYFPKPITI